jgi:hypothetical protein
MKLLEDVQVEGIKLYADIQNTSAVRVFIET